MDLNVDFSITLVRKMCDVVDFLDTSELTNSERRQAVGKWAGENWVEIRELDMPIEYQEEPDWDDIPEPIDEAAGHDLIENYVTQT